MLPGLDGTGALLEDFAAALAGHFDVEVIAYPHDELLGYSQLCGLVRMRLPQQDYVLIAESFSGPVGLALAAERPAGLKALVLCASFARIDLPAPREIHALKRRRVVTAGACAAGVTPPRRAAPPAAAPLVSNLRREKGLVGMDSAPPRKA